MADIHWVLEEIFRLLEHNKESDIPSLQSEAEEEYMKLTRKLLQVDRSELSFLDNLLKCTYLKDWKRAKWHLDGAKSQYKRFILPFWQNEKDYQRYLDAEKHGRQNHDRNTDRIELDYKSDSHIPYNKVSKGTIHQNDAHSDYLQSHRTTNGHDSGRIPVDRDATRQPSYLGQPRRDVPPSEVHERIKFSSYERRDTKGTVTEPKQTESHKTNTDANTSDTDELAAKNMDERKEITRRFNELRSKEYKTALTDIQEMGIHEKKATACLIHIVQDAYTMCKEEAESQMKQIFTAMITIIAEGKLKVLETSSNYKGDKHLLLQYRKDVASMSIKRLQQDFSKEQLLSVLYGTNVTLKKDGSVEKFANKCVSLLWWMVVQDPPMYVYEGRDSRFNPELFKEYKTTGSVVEFYRWPAVLSHKDGKVLAKGIAECH